MAVVIPIKKIDMDDGSLPLARTALLTLSKTKISGAQQSIINIIWVETYGWYNQDSPYSQGIKKRHTKAQISHETFIKETWMGKTEVSRAINQLLDWKIIGRDKNTQPYTYWFNVNAEEWSSDAFRVNRIVNSKQNSEQLAGLLTVSESDNSKQDSEQTVNRIVNSYQGSTPETVSETDLLKKVKENILNKFNVECEFEGPAFEEALTNLVTLYREKNPNRVKEVGFVKSNIRCRDNFEGALKQGKVTLLGLAKVMINQTEELAPWDIVKEAANPPPRQKTERELEMEELTRQRLARRAQKEGG